MRCVPLMKYPGGKHKLRKWIISYLPPGELFVDVFGGAAHIIMESEYPVKIYNDIDEVLKITFRESARSQTLFKKIRETPHGEEVWTRAKHIVNDWRKNANYDDTTLAWAEIVRRRMSRDGLGKDFGRSDRIRGGQPEYKNVWDGTIQSFPFIQEKLAKISNFMSLDFEVCINMWDSPKTVFYLDPPYYPGTNSGNLYEIDMTVADHERLVNCVKNVEGLVVLSGYDNQAYSMLNWHKVEKVVNQNMGSSKVKPKRVETLWMNF